MSEQLPRRIAPEAAMWPGWRVRATRCENVAGITASYEFVVDHETDGQVYVGDNGPTGRTFDRDDYTWELLPAGPAPAVGSLWRIGGAQYVFTEDNTWTLLDRPTPAPAVGSRAPRCIEYEKASKE